MLVGRDQKWAGIVFVVLAIVTAKLASAEAATVELGCLVTKPNDEGYVSPNLRLRHGNEWLATSLYPDGRVTFRPGGAGCVDENAALWVKWPWWRKVSGKLEVETARAGGPGEALNAKMPCCYSETGFQPSIIGFPGPGCWKVTARIGGGSLSFVTLVEKLGHGPRPCNAGASPSNELQRTRPARAMEPRH